MPGERAWTRGLSFHEKRSRTSLHMNYNASMNLKGDLDSCCQCNSCAKALYYIPLPEVTDLKIATSVQHRRGSLHLIFKLLWYKWLGGLAVGSFYQYGAKRTCPNRVYSLSLHLLSVLCDFNPGQVSLVCRYGYIICLPPASFSSFCDALDLSFRLTEVLV